MTLLEKARQEHPELDEGKLVTWMCPCDLGYESLSDGCEQEGAVQEICRECWNRQADALSVGYADSKLGMSRVNHASGCSPRGGAKREGGAGNGL